LRAHVEAELPAEGVDEPDPVDVAARVGGVAHRVVVGEG
jgi:hypothetical protein